MNAMHERQTRKEANYDIPLRNQLLEIAKDDQAIRQEWRMTSRQQPQDTAKIDSIFSVMATIDSVNQQKIFKILDSRGFVGKDKVGDACRALLACCSAFIGRDAKEISAIVPKGRRERRYSS